MSSILKKSSAWDIDRRLVWAGWAAIMTVSAFVYAHKAEGGGSAIIRWHRQVRMFWGGRNIYDKEMFPNPPIVPITLLPFVALPPLACAVAWFAFKVALTTLAAIWCFRMAKDVSWKLPNWAEGLVLVCSLRPILSDLHHGNNNLLILFLVVASLYAWRNGYDVLAGLVLGLAITYKVTPALFVPYFLYKRSWRTAIASGLGVVFFLLIAPSLIIGPTFNAQCLSMWFHRILSPYVNGDVVSPTEINQSLVGVLSRLLTAPPVIVEPTRYAPRYDVNFVAWNTPRVVSGIKIFSAGVVALLAIFCRTKTTKRTDPRLFGEFALVVLTMLFVSERSWKHHYVTLLLPFAYLVPRMILPGVSRRARWLVAESLLAAMFLMGTTSSELGRFFASREGHKIAQAYGMFLWAGVVLYLAVAWRVWAERKIDPAELGRETVGGSSSHE